MKGRIALLVVMLMLQFCTLEGEAQVYCYEKQCDHFIGQFNTHEECCIVDDALTWSGPQEFCASCAIYGWTDNFPIEVRKGQVLTLTIGYLKGSPSGRTVLRVEFDPTEVALDRSSILLGVQDETIQVTVLDDGQPVEQDNITLTLVKTAGGTISDIIVTEATLLIHAAVQCPSLAFPANGNLTLSGDTFGETANYSCDTGYNLIGERSLLCGSNGSWNGAPPTCQAVQCPSLAFPAKGNLTLSGDTFGETANYSCNTGYNLIGERSLMCGSNGSWNGAPPTCQAIQCPHLSHPANGKLSLSGDTFRETANYSCNTEYNLFGDSRLMCGINGQWGGNPPICQAILASSGGISLNNGIIITAHIVIAVSLMANARLHWSYLFF